jgi:hypothetical protein
LGEVRIANESIYFLHWRIKVKDALSVSKVKRGFGTTKRSLLFLSNGRANYGEIFFASRALA